MSLFIIFYDIFQFSANSVFKISPPVQSRTVRKLLLFKHKDCIQTGYVESMHRTLLLKMMNVSEYFPYIYYGSQYKAIFFVVRFVAIMDSFSYLHARNDK